MITKFYLKSVLEGLGIAKGDSLFIHSGLKGLGHIEGVPSDDKKAYCQLIYEVFDELVDCEKSLGTISVPTFTHNYVRIKQPFILETTASEVGALSEFIRTKEGTVRTLHPINSVAIRGKYQDFLKDVSTSGYGMNSFFDKFARITDAKVVYFGAHINHTTYVHHIEHMVGVSYVYNKAYFEPEVIVGGNVIQKPFFNSVRYLGKNIEPDYEILKKSLMEKGLLQSVKINNFEVMVVRVQDLIDEIYSLLEEASCSLLKNEYYVTE